jgi:hypothetical protein
MWAFSQCGFRMSPHKARKNVWNAWEMLGRTETIQGENSLDFLDFLGFLGFLGFLNIFLEQKRTYFQEATGALALVEVRVDIFAFC